MIRTLRIVGLVAGLTALTVQFVLTMIDSTAAGRSVVGSIIFYFSFFTILTNMLVVVAYGGSLTAQPAFFRRPSVRAGIAVAIAVVAIVYWFLLRGLHDLGGLRQVCNVLLHYVAPPVYLAWWLIACADGSTRWRDVLWWLVYPFAYLAYTLARAPLAGEVPYPFLDFAANGARAVVVSGVTIAGLFAVLGVIAVAADHAIGARRARFSGIRQ